MQFLSDEWLAALHDAAADRPVPADDPLADVSVVIEQVVTAPSDGDERRWRLVVDHGAVSVTATDDDASAADVRLTSDRATAAAIATGERAALDAFIAGDIVLGGDVRALLEHRAALETLGALFADVRDRTTF